MTLALNSVLPYAIGAVAGVTVGAGTTYFVLSKKLEKKYAEKCDQEIAIAEDALARKYKVGAYGDLANYEPPLVVTEEAAERLIEEIEDDALQAAAQLIAEEEGYTPYSAISTKPEPQDPVERIEVLASQSSNRVNVFDDHGIVELEEFDQTKEDEKKAENLPYIVLDDVFYENAENNPQYVFTYYEDDDVLLDEHDGVVDKTTAERNLGLGNLRFGYGSSNKNTVLIQNPVSNVMFEVVRQKGSYSKEVLGFDPDDDGSPRQRRFRQED